jgi:hypothetical protein
MFKYACLIETVWFEGRRLRLTIVVIWYTITRERELRQSGWWYTLSTVISEAGGKRPRDVRFRYGDHIPNRHYNRHPSKSLDQG